VDPHYGQASEAGEAMDSELDAIQERLRALKRELDARESVAELVAEQSRQRTTAKAAAADD
jgi:hypothetical protein